MTTQEINTFRELFTDEYPHIALDQMQNSDLDEFLNRDYIKKLSLSMQLNCCCDFVMSQNLVDVQE